MACVLWSYGLVLGHTFLFPRSLQEPASKSLRYVPTMEATMALGKDVWDSADDFSRMCGVQSAMAARFYALGRMLAEAEVASLSGSNQDAAQMLRELQAHCEKLAVMLAPAEKRQPKLVSAA
jgi:hypothetical protein